MMRKYFLFFSILTGLYCNSVLRANSEDIVLSFDLDDVLSKKEKTNWSVGRGFFTLGLKGPWHPYHYYKLLMTIKELSEQEDRAQGTSNMMKDAIEILKKDGRTDFSEGLSELVERSVDPTPIISMLDLLKKLKKQGYTIVAATNQDYLQNKHYR